MLYANLNLKLEFHYKGAVKNYNKYSFAKELVSSLEEHGFLVTSFQNGLFEIKSPTFVPLFSMTEETLEPPFETKYIHCLSLLEVQDNIRNQEKFESLMEALRIVTLEAEDLMREIDEEIALAEKSKKKRP